ncbi:hypothetical protein ABZ061_28465 [Streptomyces mutabilis]|uniref:hypothetical protein n=1 Tax=Streptomyces mutabilis TaxID=67332 RepID=UPI0033A63000
MIRTLPDHDRNRSRNKPLRTVRPDLYHASHGDDGMSCVTATHFARGTMLDLLTHLAVALEAAVVPQDGAALIFHEDQRRHLPAELQAHAVVITPADGALQTALEAH